ncbi:hypothetical protein B0H12DRAFT_1323261 [Mycena haematopus]|nr:hypothetical protein B0H12DRAFT_1323261 [Mycena haematopus]
MTSDSVVSAIVESQECRQRVLQLSTQMELRNDPSLRTALRADEERMATLLVSVLNSKSDEETVLRLEGDSAQHFLDVVQETLDGGFMMVPEHNRMALRIIRKLSASCDRLPSSLFITGVEGRDEYPTFGGGFGDIYGASYGAQRVALKRMRYFLRGSELRRIHSANILIKEDWSACLTDFGLSSYADATSMTSTNRGGSLRWMAPELLDPDHFGLKFARTTATDVYAFGCLYTERPPFSSLPEPAAWMKVLAGERPERPPAPPAMSDILWQHVTEFWAQGPLMRPSTRSVVQTMIWPNAGAPLPVLSDAFSAPSAPFTPAGSPPATPPAAHKLSLPVVVSRDESIMPFSDMIDFGVGNETLLGWPDATLEEAPLVNSEDELSTALSPQLDRIQDTTVSQFSQLPDPENIRICRTAGASLSSKKSLPFSYASITPLFHGRGALVKKIALLLSTKGTTRVCITGVGGMGKTSVAVAVTESPIIKDIFPKEYIFWVPCITTKSSDLLRHNLYTQLRITAETYDSLDPLIAELNDSKQPRLLLLDNFETPWLSGPDPVEVVHILRRLAALPHIALLITMTSGVTPEGIKWEHVHLPALEPAAARDVFKNTYRDASGGLELAADESQLNNVLDSIGHIPLAITLMATSGGHLGASPDDLLADWRKAGTEMLSAGGKGRLSMDDTIALSMERGVSSDPNALRLLAVLSMLPAGTTGDNLLKWWAPTIRTSTHAAVKTLRTAALIEQNHGPFVTSRIFVRPTIQSYMSHQDRILVEVREQVHDACYDFVLRHKSIPDDHKFKADLEALATEETNIQGLLMEIPIDAPRPNAVDALVAFSLYQSWIKPSTVVASHALAVARAVYDDPHVTDRDGAARRVATAHRCLAKSLFRLDRYEEACSHFEEAAARFKKLPNGADLHCAGEASMELLETWMVIGTKHSRELKSLAEEAKANLSYDETSKYHVAHGLLGFGYFLWWADRPDEKVLAMLSAAKAIFEHLDCPASTAKCLSRMARTYAYSDEYAKALPIIKNALGKADQSGEVGLIFDTLSTTARYLIVLKSYEAASALSPRLISLSQAVGAPLDVAHSLELLAYNCAAVMDLPEARVAYQGAQMQFTKIKSTLMGRYGVDRCLDNIRRLKGLREMDWSDFSLLIKPELANER